FYKIDQLLSERGLVSFQVFLEKLEVSRATIKRDLEYLRNRLHAPIVWDREAGGYRYGEPEAGGAQYELPGLWFSAAEIHALLTMQHLLANLDPGGLLAPHIQPLMARLNALLGTAENTAEEIRRRILIVGLGKRAMKLEHFERVGSALLRRKRLFINYYARGRGETTEREVSPQRLVHYRENWYLDAWCHLRKGLRNFAVDSIQRAEILEKHAREIPERTVDAVLGPGYGIFAGQKLEWAKLRFSAERARWVSAEFWHPKQKGRYDADGSYLLEVPYADDRELLMDILKFGRNVRVLAPPSLRATVEEELRATLGGYSATT
ncbi:MAG TPA: WYL domain-containing protein, partial [Burkholderiales bacterium]|nr:WYL domain-containing protein [Burkholderiales bacterium]